MRSAISEKYDRIILGRPVVVLLGVVLLVLVSAWFAREFRLDASADSLLLEGDQSLQIFREVSEEFGTQDFLFVTFTPAEDLFSDSSLQHIAGLRDELAVLPLVDSVVSLVDVPLLKQVEGRLSDVARNYRTLESEDVDRDAAKQELLQSPIYRELIISADGRTTAL
ncbi:MAG: hypothetical protein WD709_05455, partial [Gammaproteobacteria bacterium]